MEKHTHTHTHRRKIFTREKWILEQEQQVVQSLVWYVQSCRSPHKMGTPKLRAARRVGPSFRTFRSMRVLRSVSWWEGLSRPGPTSGDVRTVLSTMNPVEVVSTVSITVSRTFSHNLSGALTRLLDPVFDVMICCCSIFAGLEGNSLSSQK